MITLNITKADGSHYWTEYFNSIEACNSWLADEQSRPYWDHTFVTSIIVPPTPTSADLKASALITVKAKRDSLLAMSDWTQLLDSALTTEKKASWATYRKALRDLPDQPGFDPNNVTWPVKE